MTKYATFFHKNSQKHAWITLGVVFSCIVIYISIIHDIYKIYDGYGLNTLTSVALGYLITYLYYFLITVHAEQEREKTILFILSQVIHLKQTIQSFYTAYAVSMKTINELATELPEHGKYLNNYAQQLISQGKSDIQCIIIKVLAEKALHKLDSLKSMNIHNQNILQFIDHSSGGFKGMQNSIEGYFLNNNEPCNIVIKAEHDHLCTMASVVIDELVKVTGLNSKELVSGANTAISAATVMKKITNPRIDDGCLGEDCKRAQHFNRGIQSVGEYLNNFNVHVEYFLSNYNDSPDMVDYIKDYISMSEKIRAQV